MSHHFTIFPCPGTGRELRGISGMALCPLDALRIRCGQGEDPKKLELRVQSCWIVQTGFLLETYELY